MRRWVSMATIAVQFKIDEKRVVRGLEEARDTLDGAGPEMMLDLSAVKRIDAPGLRALEELAARADEKAVNVVVRGASIEVYKVLKLMKLETRFSFTN
jgi:anti-anti-sigma regulatory factor